MMNFIYKLFIIIVKEVKEVIVYIDIIKKISMYSTYDTVLLKCKKVQLFASKAKPTYLYKHLQFLVHHHHHIGIFFRD